MKTPSKFKTVIMKVLLFVLVWITSLIVIGIIGACLAPNGEIHPLFAIVILIAPIALATLTVIPKRKHNISQDTASERTPVKKSNPNIYVINPQTMVFHRKTCPYAEKTYSFNKYALDSRDAAISVGYKPCKYCSP